MNDLIEGIHEQLVDLVLSSLLVRFGLLLVNPLDEIIHAVEAAQQGRFSAP